MAPALTKHVALVGFMGAGKTTIGAEVARRIGRRFVDTDEEIERLGTPIPELFAEGERVFREVEERVVCAALGEPDPAVIALGGGAVGSQRIRDVLRERALTIQLLVDLDVAWGRSQGSGRPLAADRERFSRLFEERWYEYGAAADAQANDADDVVLAAGGATPFGTVETIGAHLPRRLEPQVALIADAHVAGIHGAEVQTALAPFLVQTLNVPRGEAAKTVATADRLWRTLRLERGDVVVALGGGATTDVAGFVAATYLRGIAWVAVPTTLVGQVDAAIGGKTAIDTPHGKNLVGAFHWPLHTVLEPAFLASLPGAEVRSGMAEVVKTGLLAGEPMWELPEAEMVRRCAAFKMALCLRDPRDRGPRNALNLGHTFAHALEAAADFELSHGEAVALGLLAALRLSGLPTDEVEAVLAPERVSLDRDRAWEALLRDKKTEGGSPRLVLLEAPGKPRVGVEVPEREVRAALDELIAP